MNRTDQGWTSTFDKSEETKLENTVPTENCAQGDKPPKKGKKKVRVKRSLSKNQQVSEPRFKTQNIPDTNEPEPI